MSNGFVPVVATDLCQLMHKPTSTDAHAEAHCATEPGFLPATSPCLVLYTHSRAQADPLHPAAWSSTSRPHGQTAAGCQKHQTVTGLKVQSSQKI